jgi:Holliday junction DNA helicase RuvA
MFYSITGLVTHAESGILRMQTGALEWDLEASDFTTRSLAGRGGEVRVFTYLHHREDALTVFAFSTVEERQLFLELITVNGIGPRQALRMLSGASVDSIKAAIAGSDVDSLSQIPGIGKKTAAKIVLSLQGKLEVPVSIAGSSDRHAEIVRGLVEMGYERSRASDAVRAAAASIKGTAGEEYENEVFRKAVLALSQSG